MSLADGYRSGLHRRAAAVAFQNRSTAREADDVAAKRGAFGEDHSLCAVARTAIDSTASSRYDAIRSKVACEVWRHASTDDIAATLRARRTACLIESQGHQRRAEWGFPSCSASTAPTHCIGARALHG